jgi:hypothetical protein
LVGLVLLSLNSQKIHQITAWYVVDNF